MKLPLQMPYTSYCKSFAVAVRSVAWCRMTATLRPPRTIVSHGCVLL